MPLHARAGGDGDDEGEQGRDVREHGEREEGSWECIWGRARGYLCCLRRRSVGHASDVVTEASDRVAFEDLHICGQASTTTVSSSILKAEKDVHPSLSLLNLRLNLCLHHVGQVVHVILLLLYGIRQRLKVRLDKLHFCLVICRRFCTCLKNPISSRNATSNRIQLPFSHSSPCRYPR